MAIIPNGYLKKLKEKCNMSEQFIETILGLFNKLIEFGYISKYSINKLSKVLYDNIDSIVVSNTEQFDYKSGYYDASRKELYIKDLTNLQSVYLRLLYVLTTKEISENVFSVGYSKSSISSQNYKIVHSNFGLNRAIVSNLVCRILYTLPTTLSIVPTYRTYENDFLGVQVVSDNDIYFLEGKLLRQICFTLDINEEALYIILFKNNPKKYITKLFKKINSDEIFKKLDDVSRMYSNYNKLCYFNKLLNDNYIEIKKHCISKDEVLSEYLETEKKLKSIIIKVLTKLDSNEQSDDKIQELNLDSSLSEKINNLEENILINVSSIQGILVNLLIDRKSKYTPIKYVVYLKKLESMLVLHNKTLKYEIYESISHNVIHTNEQTCTNIIEKIKYSLANYILTNDKYAKVYSDTVFKRLLNLENLENQAFVLISNNEFAEIAYISNLDCDMSDLVKNTTFLKLKNLRHILNVSNKNSDDIESIFTKLKDTFHTFKKINIENVFICKFESSTFLLIVDKDTSNVIKVDRDLKLQLMDLSEDYNILSETRKNLPVLYKESGIKRLVSILSIFD
ncbi:MAG: hypothetical protein PHD15_02370 [Clostridia bacterium]|nr:hypothetical protein [Clostridia bacterium]MDD4386591.1 hypothetical protein [Clostridia bacterium]